MATKVKSYRINITDNPQQWDAIVIWSNWDMISQHLGTVASCDIGTNAWDIPVLDDNWQLSIDVFSGVVLDKQTYDPNNKHTNVFDYCNLDNTPEIPIVNDPIVTFKQGWVTMWSISLNQVWETEIELMSWWVTAGNGIDILCNEVSVDYDNTSIWLNCCDKLEVKDYSTIVSWAAAWATAVQADDLATVAMSGKYCDLIGKPEIPSAQIQSDWCQTNTDLADYIKNKPTIGDATITIQKNWTNVDCFTLNQTANKYLNIVLDKCDVGLSNVDNTSDADKPVSNATQCALNCKQDNIADLNTIRCNACDGKTASETIACYWDIVSHNVCEFATATQWGKADSAVQPEDLCTVATSGKYCDLTGTPTIPTDNCQLANSCWYTTCIGTLVESDLQPYAKSCDLCSVATSWKYCDLTGTPTIPTDNCELGNGCGYITNAVDDLTNYYLKCETYKKCEVDNLIANFWWFEVVSVLPTTNIKTNVIYLLWPIGTWDDKYEEWIYYNNTWTKIGETTTDLSNYAKCCDIPTDNCQLSNSCWYTTCTWTLVSSDLAPYAKCCDLKTVATSGCYCDLTGLPTMPTDNCQLANSCWYTTCTGTLVASDLNPYAKTCDLCTVATSWLYCDLTGNPSLCTVATSGKYCDLTGTPSLCNVATSWKYCDLTWTPTLATVATSWCYNDLTGLPTIPTDNCQLGNWCNYITKDVTNLTCYTPTSSLATVATSGAYCDLTWAPTLACVACSGSYEDLCCKPNLGVYQTTANMVCSLTNADNAHYPSAKAVADALSCAGAWDMLSSTYDPCNKQANAFDYTNFINTPSLCTVATSGKYCDLTWLPTIPAVLSAGNGISITSNCINVDYDWSTIKKNSWNCLYVDLSWYATTAELACKVDSSSLCTVSTSWKYCDLTGTPTLCAVATSGNYCDLTGNPSLCTVATSGKYCDLTWIPSLATVATSWKYCDLTWAPTIPDVNTKTFILSSTWDTTNATAALAYINDWWDALVIFNWAVYTLYSSSSSSVVFKSSLNTSGWNTYSTIQQATLTFTVSNDVVTTITASNTSLGKYLETDRNYTTPFTPTCNWHPATKKYIDDAVWAINSFSPSNTGSNWQVLKKTNDWYEWGGESVTSVEWKTWDVNVIDAMNQTTYNNLPNTKTSDWVWRIIYE